MKASLLELSSRISRELFTSEKWKWQEVGLKEVWFFPEYNGVKGYLGTDKIIFIALNPSFGHFPSKGDRLLYESLKKSDFCNAHLTDVIKLRLSNKQYSEIKREDRKLYNAILERNLLWLKEELKIIDKKLNIKIVAIGNETYKILKEYFRVPIFLLPHYAWTERFSEDKRKKKRRAFHRAMKRIAESF